MRKICVITGTRAEYGLLYWTMKQIQQDPDLSLQLCVTGMHLSPEFGLTYQSIEKDGFEIDKKIEILLSSDSRVGTSKSIGLAVISFAEAFEELKPDLILLLGDRYEILAAATAACIANIPIAHCHGGEITEGAFDDAIRHSITKMSHLHFVATEPYRKRVVQLGEQPDRVFNVGGLGVENIHRQELLSREDLEASLGYRLEERFIVVTFHPVTLEGGTETEQMAQLLEALDELQIQTLFTLPNSDPGSRNIIQMIQRFAEKRKRVHAHTSLGLLRYLSALKYTKAVVGNSSSGLLEAPSFKIPTINIGNRQKGRVMGETVINCATEASAITAAIRQGLSTDYGSLMKPNPYDQGLSSQKIIEEIKKASRYNLTQKHFYTLDYELD